MNQKELKEEKKSIFNFEIIDYHILYKDIFIFLGTLCLLFFINIFYTSIINLDLQTKLLFEIFFYGVIFSYIFILFNKHLFSKLSTESLKLSYRIKLILLSLSAFFFLMFVEIYEYKVKYKKDYKTEPYINQINEKISLKYANYYKHYIISNKNKTFLEYLSIRNSNTGPINFLNSLSYSEGLDFVEFKKSHQLEDGDIIRAYLKNKYLN